MFSVRRTTANRNRYTGYPKTSVVNAGSLWMHTLNPLILEGMWLSDRQRCESIPHQ